MRRSPSALRRRHTVSVVDPPIASDDTRGRRGRPASARHRPTAEWAAHALAEVAGAGHRSGGARAAVIASLAEQECCRSAQEIFDQLRGEGRRVGIASVYRVLDLLVSLGLVQRLDLGGGIARYEPALPGGEHHHHLVCVDCGEVRPFEDPQLERALEGTADAVGLHRRGPRRGPAGPLPRLPGYFFTVNGTTSVCLCPSAAVMRQVTR